MILPALCLLLGFPSACGEQVAGGVISSKEWKVRRAPQKEEEFIGAVRYRSAASLLRADWALYKHESHDWQAKGNVNIEHKLTSGDTLRGRGDEAFYNDKNRAGSMLARRLVEFSRTPPSGDPDYGRAKSARWNDDHVIVSEQVHLWGPRLKLWSSRADYDRRNSELTLSGGRPVLQKLEGSWTGAVKADKITAWDKSKKMAADGKTHGWIRFKRR